MSNGPTNSPPEAAVLDEESIRKLETLSTNTICTARMRGNYLTGVPIGILFPFNFLNRLPDDQRNRVKSIPLPFSSQDSSGKINEIYILLNESVNKQEYVPLSQAQIIEEQNRR